MADLNKKTYQQLINLLGTVSGDKYRRYVESISQFIEAGKKLLQNK